MNLSENFKSAIVDYSYFLGNNYPEKATLKIVSDRYKLSGTERSILQRGISAKNISLKRKLKLIKPEEATNKPLSIDFYNVAYTIHNYLLGATLYISTDGLLRDTGENHGKIKNEKYFFKSIELIFEYLKKLQTKHFIFYLDSPVSNSGKTKAELSKLIDKNNLTGEALCVKSADYYLIHEKGNICSTSDSAIIDKKEKIFDLAFFILKYNYKADFIKLNSLLKKGKSI